jgi:hypothetical protein|tara:strand:- start:3962 stop:4351 length:390 start_codon:yes stop_codon:yes gene_type:complete
MKYKRMKSWGKYRSGLEKRIAEELNLSGVKFKYETLKISYTKPATPHKYTPDFILPNGIIIEAKGLFSSADRKKHILVKEQHPDLDIRFVFSNSRKKLYKGSDTLYADWCNRHGFLFADKEIPSDWIGD